jgi:predicted HicB family RNase H-like nuclease
MNKLNYREYFGTIEYSEADNCFYGKVLGMSRDRITYEGESAAELLDDFKGAIDMYLEHCQAKGIKPEKSYNDMLNIRIPSEVQSRIAKYAEINGTSINSFICDSIERRLETV